MQVLYTFATQRFSRGALFNIVVAVFMAWFVAFGIMYPFHETMHFHGMAESVLEGLPSGLAGAVGMVRYSLGPSHSTLLLQYLFVMRSILDCTDANETVVIRQSHRPVGGFLGLMACFCDLWIGHGWNHDRLLNTKGAKGRDGGYAVRR